MSNAARSVTALPIRRVWECMGTVFSVDVRDGGVDRAVIDDLVAWSHWADATFSTYRPDSVVSRIARGELSRSSCSADVLEVLDHCDALTLITGGYFTANPDGALDPSGYVKGWAISRISQRLQQAGSTSHCVNGGGDVQCIGEAAVGRPWRVGIAHPLQPDRYVRVVQGSGVLAVATSGGAERGAHIVDPHTGSRPTGLASLTLVGTDVAEVDAYATACIAMGANCLDWLAERPHLRAVLVRSDGDVLTTPNWATS
jgi:thiamine biosynthesis lipoprotein